MKFKKGNSLISLYWFFILGIIVGGVLIMTNAFYSAPYDVRNMEAELLGNHVANCISPEGKMHHLLIIGGRFFPAFKEDFEGKCKLNFAGFEDWDIEEYYVHVEIFKGAAKIPSYNLSAGNKNWEIDCEAEGVKFNKLPVCFNKTYYSYDNQSTLWRIELLSAVSKVQENVK